MPDGSNNSESTSPDQLPEFIAHYRISRRLGKGGMGEVFLAEDTKQHRRKVALKVLPEELTRSETRVRRFKQEYLRDEVGKLPHVYFGWSEGNPISYLLKYIAFGEGDTAPVTHEVLRQAEKDSNRRPIVHVGG
jgi:serine/threonine protein kinase